MCEGCRQHAAEIKRARRAKLREKRPPVTAPGKTNWNLYVKAMMSLPEIQELPGNQRLAAIGQMWREAKTLGGTPAESP